MRRRGIPPGAHSRHRAQPLQRRCGSRSISANPIHPEQPDSRRVDWRQGQGSWISTCVHRRKAWWKPEFLQQLDDDDHRAGRRRCPGRHWQAGRRTRTRPPHSGSIAQREPIGGRGTPGSSRILASTTTAPAGWTISGLRSISATSGCASTSALTRRRTFSRAPTSARAAPR
jgi:hypothetical protein